MKTIFLNYCTVFLFILFASCKKDADSAFNSNNSATPLVSYAGQRLAVSFAENLTSPWLELFPDTVYTSFNTQSALFRSMPSGSEDKIISFYLPKGFMAVFAANSDGTGESACFVAKDSTIKANLPARLRNNISYIRYKTINNPEKKGTASTNDAAVQAFAAQWYYSWGLNKASFIEQQYVPMTWGKGACTDSNVKYLAERTDIDHLLSFNEPDNTSQSNIPNIDTAVQRYKIMQKTGLRLGTPVVTQDQAFGSGKWLTNFMDKAHSEKLRIDFIAVHWYDWGNQTNNAATDSLTAERVFSRFVTYIERVSQAYPGYPIWVTEYNANINRTSEVVHKYFMKLSADWMNGNSLIEKYSYFFPNTVPAVNSDNTLTAAGTYWKSLVSAKSFTGNIISDAILFK